MSSEILIELFKEVLVEAKSYYDLNPNSWFLFDPMGVALKDNKGGKITVNAFKGKFFFSKKSGKISYFHNKLNILYNFDISYEKALILGNLAFDRRKAIKKINDSNMDTKFKENIRK